MNYQPTYLGELELNEETLAHYGVKGMKWGVIRRKLRNGLAKGTKTVRKVLRRKPDEITTRYGFKKLNKRDDGRATSRNGQQISSSSYRRGLAAARQRAKVNYNNMRTSPPNYSSGSKAEGMADYFRSMYNPSGSSHRNRPNYQPKTNEERNAMETVSRNYELDMWRETLANDPFLLKAHDLVDTTYKNVNGKIVKTKKKKTAGVMGSDPRYR